MIDLLQIILMRFSTSFQSLTYERSSMTITVMLLPSCQWLYCQALSIMSCTSAKDRPVP